MLGTKYEQYEHIETSLPFVLRTDIERTSLYHSKAGNFHEELELQLCTRGEGSVLLDGVRYPFAEGDIIVANSGVLYCTDSNGYLAYDCLIIKSTYCKEVGIDPARLAFAPI